MTEYEVKIEDGGEKTVKCSDCGKPLLHYRMYAKADIAQKLRATCPFCKGQSFVHEIDGLAYVGPIGREEVYDSTVIKDITTLPDGTSIYEMMKNA